MMTYIVQAMTAEDYFNYMTGSNNYGVETMRIEVMSAELAAEAVENCGYVVNKNNIKTTDEVEAEARARAERRKAADEAEAKAKARKVENEARKAAEAGMTVAEYRAEKNRKAALRRAERDLERAEAEVERLKAYIEGLKK